MTTEYGKVQRLLAFVTSKNVCTISCDCCDKYIQRDHTTRTQVARNAKVAGWTSKDGNVYCPTCSSLGK